MNSAENLLGSLSVDDMSIRLDCTERELRESLPHWSVCGVHLAAGAEVTDLGFMPDSLVPEEFLPLDVGHADRMTPFLAALDTPPGLCVGFGRATRDTIPVAGMLAETDRPDFTPLYGSLHELHPFKGRLMAALPARPGTRTTTVIDPRFKQYSESRQGIWVGLHYDNGLTSAGEGERFPAGTRVAEAERRILLNTGPGRRRFVFALNMTALHLSDQVRPGEPDHIPDSRQLLAFLREQPDRVEKITCLVVTMEPGEYVIFPAGIALHDGSMHGIDQESVAVVLNGKFPRWSELRADAAASMS